MEEPGRRLDPSVRRLWWASGFLIVVPAVAAGFAAAAGFHVPLWVAGAGTVVATALAAVIPPLLYRRWRFEIRERDLFYSRGALFHRKVLVPFDRIQYVETKHGPLDRAFGLAQVAVYTAAGLAATIPGLPKAEADQIREELSRVAGTQSV